MSTHVLVPGLQTLFAYDLAHEWREMTGLPCVLAIWAARRDSLGAAPALVADFLASKEFGLAHLEQIAEDASLKLGMPAAALERYLRENIDFSLDEANLAGLDLYYRLAAASGLIERVQPLDLVGAVEYAIRPATTASSKG
jgi:chorismate dehydratase